MLRETDIDTFSTFGEGDYKVSVLKDGLRMTKAHIDDVKLTKLYI